MPFKSDKQRKWMWANDPEMAKKWAKEEQKEAVQVNIDKVLKNSKIKQLMRRLGIRADKSKASALKILNYLASNPHALAAIKIAFESVKEERDYKAEYKKYGSSTKAKKYRAELNQYNRKKGTYGNGDGKDASHKGGKIAGFEAESKNRGRAEKSRLKQEIRRMVREELYNSQGEQTDFKKGDLVKDINPDCPHVGSEGEVTKVGNGTITFKVTNNGKAYQEDDVLEKTVDQMVKLKESVNEGRLNSKIKKAILIAIEMSGNMTGATKKIEKIKKGLSNDKKVKDALRLANESVNEAKVLKFSDIKDRTLEKHLKVVTKKVGAELKKISGGFQVSGTDIKGLTAVVDYVFDKSIKKGVMKGGGMSKIELANESVIVEFNKYRLGGLLDSKLKKRLERTIKIIGGKVDAVGDDYIKFRIGSMDLNRLPAVIKKLDRNKNVWIGDKYSKNIWDRRRNIDKLESVNEAGGVVTAWIQQKPRGYWAVFNKKGESQFEGNKRFMIKILKKASTLSPNAIGSILDRARPGAKHLEFKAQFSRYYYNETVEEMLNPPNYLDNQAPTPVNSPEDENLVSRGKRTKKSGQPKFGTFRNESIKLDGDKEMIKLKDLITVNEKISKEEWAEYPKYARKLKPYMKRLLKIPVKVRVIKQANHNPWIEIRVARFGKDVIPNDFRKRALKVIGGGSRARDMDNIHYGNITAGSVSMYHSDWVKLLGNKVR